LYISLVWIHLTFEKHKHISLSLFSATPNSVNRYAAPTPTVFLTSFASKTFAKRSVELTAIADPMKSVKVFSAYKDAGQTRIVQAKNLAKTTNVLVSQMS
jgi:hypothetical protein